MLRRPVKPVQCLLRSVKSCEEHGKDPVLKVRSTRWATP